MSWERLGVGLTRRVLGGRKRSTKGDRREGRRGVRFTTKNYKYGGGVKLYTYQPTTETSLNSICPAENCGTLWHKATT